MENFSSVLLEGLIRFGKYPSSDEYILLKSNGYKLFIDLCPNEEITWEPYSKEGIEYINHPIKDRTPVNKDKEEEFRTLIKYLFQKIRQNKKIYIHCRGGHGRSAVVAAILFGRITGQTGEQCLKIIRDAHQNRLEMKPQWRKMGAPQTVAQKNFVLSELKIYSDYEIKYPYKIDDEGYVVVFFID